MKEKEESKVTLEALRKSNPEILEAIKAEALEAAKKEADKTTDDNFVSADTHESLRESHETLVIGLKIAESKILDSVKDAEDRKKVEDELTESLRGKSDEKMDEVIESRKVFLKSVGAKVVGQPAKEDQSEKGYHIGGLLSEARPAYEKLYETA